MMLRSIGILLAIELPTCGIAYLL